MVGNQVRFTGANVLFIGVKDLCTFKKINAALRTELARQGCEFKAFRSTDDWELENPILVQTLLENRLDIIHIRNDAAYSIENMQLICRELAEAIRKYKNKTMVVLADSLRDELALIFSSKGISVRNEALPTLIQEYWDAVNAPERKRIGA